MIHRLHRIAWAIAQGLADYLTSAYDRRVAERRSERLTREEWN